MKKYAIFALLFAAVAAFAAFDVTKAPNVIPNAFTQMVAFPADGLTFDLKLDVGSIGAASTATAFILCY